MMSKYCQIVIATSGKIPTFAAANAKSVCKGIVLWRDGRVVDYTGLENRRTATCRGFESLSLRHRENLKRQKP